MFNKVMIGEREVGMKSVASCDLYYRQIFHEDPTKLQYSEDFDEAATIGFVQRMGFVMAMCAERSRAEMAELNEDAYFDWMDGFDRADYMSALPDIKRTYEGQQLTTTDAKKNTDQPSES